MYNKLINNKVISIYKYSYMLNKISFNERLLALLIFEFDTTKPYIILVLHVKQRYSLLLFINKMTETKFYVIFCNFFVPITRGHDIFYGLVNFRYRKKTSYKSQEKKLIYYFKCIAINTLLFLLNYSMSCFY